MYSPKETICIWDCDDKPNINLECFFVFWNKAFTVDSESLLIGDILELNSEELKQDYLKFIYNLGASSGLGQSVIQQFKIRRNLSYWWMSLLVEKSNWAKSPQISNVVKLMALDLIVRGSGCSKIYVKSDDNGLLQSIERWCATKDIDFYSLSDKVLLRKSFPKSMYDINRLYTLKGISWLIREVCFSIPFCFLKPSGFAGQDTKAIFVSYLSTTKVDDSYGRNFNSAFWGPLPEYLYKEKIPATWLFLPSNRFSSFVVFNTFAMLKRKKGSLGRYVLLSSFFNWQVLQKTIRDWLYVLRKSNKIIEELKVSSGPFWPLIRGDVARTIFGSEIVSSLFYLSLFESVAAEVSSEPQIIYLAENQPWEIGLISAFECRGNRLTGFAHSTIRYWDLRYFNDSRCYEGKGVDFMPRPDYLAVNGLNDKVQMINSGYPSNAVLEVESLRYLYLNKLASRIKRNESGLKSLLVLGDFLKGDTVFMLAFLRAPEVRRILENVKVTIKPHPACPLELSDIEGINASIENTDLGELLINADVVYTGNVSSAVVEAYCLGKSVISARNPSRLDMSPLRGMRGVSFVRDEKAFENSLVRCLAGSEASEKLNFFRLDSGMERWKRLIDI